MKRTVSLIVAILLVVASINPLVHSTSFAATSSSSSKSSTTLTVTKDTNLYEKSSTKSTKLIILRKNVQITYKAATASFYKVEVDGITGYVLKKNVSAETTAATKQTSKGSGTRSNPYKIGETATYDGLKDAYVYTYKIEITLTKIIRGDEALNMVTSANRFNKVPEFGKEYILALFDIKVLETKDDKAARVNNAMFDFVSTDGVTYNEFVSVASLEPSFREAYAGSQHQGYAYKIIKSGDIPMINFRDIWFSIE